MTKLGPFYAPLLITMTAKDDTKARLEALSTDKSFIVQAPAGSGKTEILTQRVLALLTTVENPEQIIAITFTKKAASEMRARIISSLELGKKKMPPTEAHKQTTWALAKKVLERDAQKDWNLLLQPLRLRIKTIDSLCQFLCHQMPLTAGPTATLGVSDNVLQDYLNASAKGLEFLLSNKDYQTEANLLLMHLGNDQQRLIELFANLLAVREQWLPLLFQEEEYTKEELQRALNVFKKEAVSLCKRHFPKDATPLFNELLPIFLQEENSPLNYPSLSQENLSFCQWQKIAKLLLTTQNKFKTRLTKREGFASPSEARCKVEKERATIKKEMGQSLLNLFSLNTPLLNAFTHCLKVPLEQPEEESFELINAIKKLLPMLAATLEVHFKQHQCIDFNALSMNALLALGEEDSPSELGLYMDYKISHLLIDEFQDTSKQQFKLLERLTADWDNYCGKTLFLVGDPMQSIYRFRQAEVECFLKAKDYGVGLIRLEYLQLTKNFRSTTALVEFANKTFQNVFPTVDDVALGAVSFHHSSAANDEKDNSKIVFYHAEDEQCQATAIAKLIQTHTKQSIAVLTRTRRELSLIITALKAHKISFQGVDIQALGSQSCIADLISLTEFSNQPGNALNLAEVLHSPFCGISYQTINTLKESVETLSISKIKALDFTALPIEETELQYLIRFLKHYNDNFVQHTFLPFKVRLYAFFELLGGYKLFREEEKQSIDEFWVLLEQHSNSCGIKSLSQFRQTISEKYAKDNSNSLVNLMTIHKSKGLEFDTVILPSLEKKSLRSEPPLVRFNTINEPGQKESLVIAPIKSVYKTEDKLYTFLNYLESLKLDNELKRLLYVAVTRAKKNLYLFTTNSCEENPPKKSFLEMLSYQKNCVQSIVLPSNQSATQESVCLSNSHYLRIAKPTAAISANTSDEFKETDRSTLFSQTASHDKIGTLLHELIFFYNQCGKNSQRSKKHLNLLITNANLDCVEKEEALKKGLITLKNLSVCPIANWILKTHDSAKNEFSLITRDRKFIIDRTFVDDAIRWVIDYKFGVSKAEQYFGQLKNYASLFDTKTTKPLIACMLYYPLTGRYFCYNYHQGELIPCNPPLSKEFITRSLDA